MKNDVKSATLADIAEKMKGIDIAILSTHTDNGEIARRPMSNNGDVTYNGTSYFFTTEDARCVKDIGRDPKVARLAIRRSPASLPVGRMCRWKDAPNWSATRRPSGSIGRRISIIGSSKARTRPVLS
jgi:Pyridoxamine 5'-phosphate oxidase like